MTWTTFHRRGEVLRTVTATADARRDGLLPMDVEGVPETFGDELGLLAALQLRWHTRLSGHLEHALMHQPLDIDDAVAGAWHATADELPGTRLGPRPLPRRAARRRHGRCCCARRPPRSTCSWPRWPGAAAATGAATAAAGRALEAAGAGDVPPGDGRE